MAFAKAQTLKEAINSCSKEPKMSWYHIQDKRLKLAIKAKPNARCTQVREITDTEIVVNVR